MTNYIVRFGNLTDLKSFVKKLRKDSKIRGHMQILSGKKEYDESDEQFVSGVMLGKFNEISKLTISYATRGMIGGAAVGGISSLLAVYLGLSSMSVSTVPVLVAGAIIFYGAAVGSLLGLMIANMFKKREETVYEGEYTLFITEVQEDRREIIIESAKNSNSLEVKEYGLKF